jgi:hypothetical protein
MVLASVVRLKCRRARAAVVIHRDGGGGGIRTPETLSGLTVFKTAGFNRSPTPPFLILTDPVTWAHLGPFKVSVAAFWCNCH